MVASPADLVSGRPLAPADGRPAVAAVDRYLADKVQPLPAETGYAVGQGGSSSAPPAPVSPTEAQ
jgi:type IV pilus biogenesis protein CpaD/CtpE